MNADLAKSLTAYTEHILREVYLPRILSCLKKLSRERVWWRANQASNSVGNLVLHLSGNVRQWIIAGLGGALDLRQRDQEFLEQGPVPRRVLERSLRGTVEEACGILRALSSEDLARVYRIQGFKVTGMEAALHVAEHFSHHAGQIILMTKMLTGTGLNFTHLPGGKKMRSRYLPAL